MAVVIVSVPRAFLAPPLETAWPILIVVFYELLLRETVHDHEQDQLRHRLAAWAGDLRRSRLRKQQRRASGNRAPAELGSCHVVPPCAASLPQSDAISSL